MANSGESNLSRYQRDKLDKILNIIFLAKHETTKKRNDSDIENERTNEGNDENVNPKGEYPLRKSSKTAKEDDETTDGKTAPRNYRKIKPPPIHASGITLGDLIKEAMKVNINQNNHFLVQVTNNSSMKDLITIKYVAYQKARWERPRKKIVLQCKKCQRLGHVSYNCNFQQRCVKCAETHEKDKCEIETKHERKN
ncbi:hypothetical protein PV326_007898 [Microctonus aethiopoides]|nr:hypothetical protein PV326_007898 [Microctonus aethiopoides]